MRYWSVFAILLTISLHCAADTLENKSNLAWAYAENADEAYVNGNYYLALDYTEFALNSFTELGDSVAMAGMYDMLSLIYDTFGEYPEALNASQEALKIYVALDDKEGMAYAYNDIGVIHYYRNDLIQAEDYYNKSYDMFNLIGDEYGIAIYYNNVANIYSDRGEYEEALILYKKAYESDVKGEDLEGQSITLCNIGETYMWMGELDKAEEHIKESITIAELYGDPWTAINPLHALGELFWERGEIDSAIVHIMRSGQIAGTIGALPELSDAYFLLYSLYKDEDQSAEALKYFELYTEMEDSIFNVHNAALVHEMEARFKNLEKDKEIEILEQEQEIKDLTIESQNTQQWLLLGGLGVVLLVALLIARGFVIKRRSNRLLSEQKAVIEEKNREITDSIVYAKRIQEAILPPEKAMQQVLANSFVYFKPKDIVAGDFYWLEEVNGQVLFAAADCTGHGVPGALVSVVCHNALKRAVREFGLIEPGVILDKTRELVIETFEAGEEDVKDGMDVALCCLDRTNMKLNYAGANNPVWIVRKDELIEHKGTKQPVGKGKFHGSFESHTIELQKDDQIYIFSDGYVDQFGGDQGKKFMVKRFRELLLTIAYKELSQQRHELDHAFESWRGELEQVDDVCVIGVRV